MAQPRSALLASLLILSLSGCTKLFGGGGADASTPPDDGSTATAVAPIADAATAPDDAAVPTAADQIFLPPGACIDPRADAVKRAAGNGGVPLETPIDLDGDGKPDKAIRVGLASDDRASATSLYVMRGTCGVFVGDVSASTVKLSGNRSKGLRSIEAISNNGGCTDPCTCKDQSTAFFFNGKTYQSSGKPKDVARKCVDGGVKFPLPKCGPEQLLFAEDESSPPFCSRVCSVDADCKPAKCDGVGFVVDNKTGFVFTGVGRANIVCAKGAPATAPSAAPTAAATALVVPPGSPAIIQNPKLLDCPSGYTKLTGPKTCNKSCRTEKCTGGTTCTPPMSVCM